MLITMIMMMMVKLVMIGIERVIVIHLHLRVTYIGEQIQYLVVRFICNSWSFIWTLCSLSSKTLRIVFEKIDFLRRRSEYLQWVPNPDLPFSICDENEVLVLGKPGNRGKSGGLVLFLKIPFSAHVPPKTSNLLYSKVFYRIAQWLQLKKHLWLRWRNINFYISKSPFIDIRQKLVSQLSKCE